MIFVYDVTRRETFDSLDATWLREVEMYSTVAEAVKMVVANKTDLAEAREVSAEEGIALARRCGALFVETSALGAVAVDQAFEELVLKVLDTPSLLGGPLSNLSLGQRAQAPAQSSCCW